VAPGPSGTPDDGRPEGAVPDDGRPEGGVPDDAGVPGWEQIVTEHSARVYRLAYRLTGNQHDAEDLTQETFVRVFRSLSTYTPGTFEGWLHRITTNLFLDQVRRRRRIRIDPWGDGTDQIAGPIGLSPERGFEHANLDQDVQRALDALPPEFRAAVVLCDMEGLSYEEIAVTLGIKLGTVRSRIHRGRAQLRQALAHRAPTTSAGVPTAVPTAVSTGGPLGPDAGTATGVPRPRAHHAGSTVGGR
jgi:RNA polymerase sigma-70 factor (ECF subfamily)